MTGTVFYTAWIHFKLTLAQRRQQCFWIMFTYGSISAFVGGKVNCVHRQWFQVVLLSPCSDFHDKTIFAFNPVLPEGRKIQKSLCTEMSPDSQNCWMILCAVDGGITQFVDIFCELLPIFTSERLCFFKMLVLYPIMLLSICLIILLFASYCSSCFFLLPLTFPAFSCPILIYLDVLLLQIQDEGPFFMK